MPRKKVNRFFVGIFAVVLAVGCLLFFVASWESVSLKEYETTESEYNYLQNGTMILNKNYTRIVENYFPFRFDIYHANITKKFFNGTVISEIDNKEEILKSENITIDMMEWSRKYGDTNIKPPLREINSPTFPGIRTIGLSKNIIKINWYILVTETGPGSRPAYNYDLSYEISPKLIPGFSAYDLIIPSVISSSMWAPFFDAIFYIFFIGAGFAFSWILFRNEFWIAYKNEVTKFDTKDAYTFVKMDFDLKGNMSVLEQKLRILNYGPEKLTTHGRGIIFGPSIQFLKLSISNLMKKHQNQYALINEEKLEKEFSKYTEKSSKLESIIPKSQSLTVILAFLASIGFSFSWNVGAATPFVYSFGLFYLFLNFGSSLYLFRKVGGEKKWIIIGILTLLLVVFSPEILLRLRQFS